MAKQATTCRRKTSADGRRTRTPREAARRLAQLGKEIAREHPRPEETSTDTLRRLRGWVR